MGMGIRVGMVIIVKKLGIRMGIGIEKTMDREWEWEFGTLFRAGIGIGILKNVHTIPLTKLFGRDGDAKAVYMLRQGTPLHCICIATLCNKRFLSLGRRFNEAS